MCLENVTAATSQPILSTYYYRPHCTFSAWLVAGKVSELMVKFIAKVLPLRPLFATCLHDLALSLSLVIRVSFLF